MQRVLTCSDIADIDALHATFLQSIELFVGIQVMGDRLAVQLDIDGIEPNFSSLASDTKIAIWVSEG